MPAGNPTYSRSKASGLDLVQEIINESISAGATSNFDLDVTGLSTITIWASLLATVTAADLTLTVLLFRADGSTVTATAVPTIRATATASDGTNVATVVQYDVRGVPKVRVALKNGNVGAKTGVVTLYGSVR